MKKTIITTLFMCITAITMHAQTAEQRPLIDSIATRMMSLRGINLIETTCGIENMYVAPNTFAVEIALYKVQKLALEKALSEVYADCSDEELKSVHEFTACQAYKYINSIDIEATYIQSLISTAITNAAMKAIGRELINTAHDEFTAIIAHELRSAVASQMIRKSDLKIDNKEFTAAYDRFHKKQNKEFLKMLLAKRIGDRLDKRNIEVNRETALNEAMNLYPAMQRAALYQYMPLEFMTAAADFYNTPAGEKFADTRILQALDMYEHNSIGSAVEEFKAAIAGLQPQDYNEYIGIRKNMDFTACKKIRKTETIKYKKGTYTGETLDGNPDGTGTYTDKKGVKYSGSFNDGDMHGCMTVTQPDGSQKLEMWAAGKKMKQQSIGRSADGSVKTPPTYTDDEDTELAMGYGYKTKDTTASIGMFIDDELHGEGTVINDIEESKGTFAHGRLVDGTIIRKQNDNSTRQFKGKIENLECKEYYWTINQGTTLIKNPTTGTIWQIIGRTISGRIDGENENTYKNKWQTVNEKGFFAYNDLYGDCIVQKVENDSSSIYRYKGYIIDGRMYGKGIMQQTHKNKFHPGGMTMHINGMHFGASGETVQIEFNGEFENDKFVNGKISTSNDDWYEGRFVDNILVEGKCRSTNGNNVTLLNNHRLYEGEIKDGKPHGQGTLVTLSGNTQEGTFENGKLVKGTIKNYSGRIIKRLQ